MTTSDHLMNITVWLVVLWVMYRQLFSPPALNRNILLMQVFACGWIFTLRNWDVQSAIDTAYGGRIPLGGALRITVMLVAVIGYWKFLQLLPSPDAIPHYTHRFTALWDSLPWLTLGSLILSLFFCAIGYLSYFQSYFLNQTLGDIAISLMIMGVFFPINYRLLQTETKTDLRIKYGANMGLCVLYLLAFYASSRHSFRNILGEVELAPRQYPLLALGGAICIILQIMPFKAMRWLRMPWEYLTFWRLVRLEQQAALASGGIPYGQRWVKPTTLKAHQHSLMIQLLDHQVYLPPEQTRLHRSIAAWVDNDPYLQARQQEAHERSQTYNQ